MKKSLLLVALFAAIAAGMRAQTDLTVHSFADATWADDEFGETYTAVGNFFHVSSNGQFAVGYDDQEIGSTQGGAFVWRHEYPDSLEFINTSANRISACDVTDDGVIVGSFEERDPSTMEATVCYPGWKTPDGEWTALPVPEEYSTGQAKTYDFMSEARAVTPDGNYIAGYIPLVVGYNSKWGWDIVYTTPIRWKKNGDTYEIAQTYTKLGEAGESYLYNDGELAVCDDDMNYKIFIVWDISDDGQTIAGVNTAENGGQNPAIIRDGKLIQLYDCNTEKTFNGGVCTSIDANGNVYGYFQGDDLAYKYFVYNTEGKLVFFDSLVTCATEDGTTIGQSQFGVSYILDCSHDGKVVVGAGIGSLGFGSYTYPVLASDDSKTAIRGAEATNGSLSIDCRGGDMLYINGIYSHATIYNAAGGRVMTGGQGKAFSLKDLPRGTYIVKVEAPQGGKTFKVAK